MLTFAPDTPCVRCVAARRPVLFSPADAAAARIPGGQYGDPATMADYATFLAVPLSARGGVAGFLVLARTAARPVR